jgi:hypothetical protein
MDVANADLDHEEHTDAAQGETLWVPKTCVTTFDQQRPYAM